MFAPADFYYSWHSPSLAPTQKDKGAVLYVSAFFLNTHLTI